MRAALALGILTASVGTHARGADTPPRAPGDASTFTFIFENDLFGDTDAQYTNGMQLSWLSKDLENYIDATEVPPALLRLARWLPFIHAPDRLHNVGLSLGQQMFTPADTARRDLIVDDRPYAGWLYGGVSFISKSATRMDAMEVQAGVVGPWSLAEDAQNLVHDLRDLPSANGWDNQLENEPGVMLIYERRHRWSHALGPDGWGCDLISNMGGTLGNVYTYLNGGAEVRLGWNLPADFGTSIIRPGGDTNGPSSAADPRLNGPHAFGVHLFAGVSGRLVLRDVFLDGNTFEDSHEIDKESFVGDYVIGASLVFRQWKVSYAQNFRTREFERQPSHHNFGSVSISWTF
ncbi:MAG: lipid A deacylase LpxR family protein [Gammaproteobacteria bacterium]